MIKVETVRNMVRVEISGDGVAAENALAENILKVLQAEEAVREYINRGDFFIVFPTNATPIAELVADIKKLLGI